MSDTNQNIVKLIKTVSSLCANDLTANVMKLVADGNLSVKDNAQLEKLLSVINQSCEAAYSKSYKSIMRSVEQILIDAQKNQSSKTSKK